MWGTGRRSLLRTPFVAYSLYFPPSVIPPSKAAEALQSLGNFLRLGRKHHPASHQLRRVMLAEIFFLACRVAFTITCNAQSSKKKSAEAVLEAMLPTHFLVPSSRVRHSWQRLVARNVVLGSSDSSKRKAVSRHAFDSLKDTKRFM